MFSSLIAFLGLTSVVLAGPYKRFDGLSVKLAGPSSNVSSVEDLTLVATITNSQDFGVKLLKFGTILDSTLPTRSFRVTKDGVDVPFTGIKLSVSLEEADDSAYSILGPGQSVTVTHKVASLYDFESVGAGAFTFEPIAAFQLSTSETKVASLVNLDRISASANSVIVNLSGDLTKRSLPSKRAVDICTTSSRKSFIDASYTEAKSLASRSVSYISSFGTGDSLYRAYWGATAASTISGVFSRVASESSSSRTLSCVDSFGACTSGVIAYTVISTTNIYFCSLFFNEVPSTNLCSGTTVASRNVRGGTTLHEMTHATSGTDDIIYGCASDQGLSDANARANADNYNCFSTQVYANTAC
ncbi:Metalloprotease [Mycena floridula]|nr:Metalloprotease [Mycena floridula]